MIDSKQAETFTSFCNRYSCYTRECFVRHTNMICNCLQLHSTQFTFANIILCCYAYSWLTKQSASNMFDTKLSVANHANTTNCIINYCAWIVPRSKYQLWHL